MPRRRYRKKRYTKRKGRNYGSYLDTASKALTVAYAVKRLINVERKVNDVNGSDSVTDAGIITLLNGIAQGDTAVTRDGSSAKMLRVSIYGNLILHPSATSSIIRLMLIQKKDNDSSTVTLANVLTGTPNVNSHYDKDEIHKFNVLYDKRHQLALGALDAKVYMINATLDMKVRYDGATAAVTDLTKNGLYLIALGTEATNDPTHIFQSRVTYVDN